MEHEVITRGTTRFCPRCGTFEGYFACGGGECKPVPESEKWWKTNEKPSFEPQADPATH